VSVEDWDARLREAGLRSTGQRRAVLAALDRLRHATVDELAEEVQRSLPEVSLSTVYRTLETLDEVGLVTHAHLHHGSPTYHSVDDEPHIHLVCSDCGAVGQQPVDVAVGLAEAVRASVGFRADLRHLTLHGWCAACAEAARVEADADADVVADHEEAARAGTDADPDAAADQAEADADRDSDPAPASSTPDQTEHSGSPQASPTFPPT
jgi:Fur family ferric uptake transcriptional regulator